MGVSLTFTCRCCDCTSTTSCGFLDAISGRLDRVCDRCQTCGGRCLRIRVAVALAWVGLFGGLTWAALTGVAP